MTRDRHAPGVRLITLFVYSGTRSREFCSSLFSKANRLTHSSSERKKLHDKVYPKGYVEMLEQQQGQLVAGLQEMYRRLQTAQGWNGPDLPEATGHPLTHDILAALDLLESKHDDSGEFETFEEDFDTLQSKLVASGASFTQRRGSFSSDSEHSHHGHTRSASHDTPKLSNSPVYEESFNDFDLDNIDSPIPQHRVLQQQKQSMKVPSQLQQQQQQQQGSPICTDPRFYEPQWAMDATRFVYSPSELDANLDDLNNDMTALGGPWDNGSAFNFNMADMAAAFPPQLSQTAVAQSMDPMDMDFNQFIQVMT